MLGQNYPILEKTWISDLNYTLKIQAPDLARKAEPGQFVILRLDEQGERFPLTLADWDAEQGWIKLIIQKVGLSTTQLSEMEVGDAILDLVGPLGLPIEVKKYEGAVICVGGGVGIAPLYPKAKALHEAGNYIISILGARNQSLLMLEDEMSEVSDELFITTDDGSKGCKGLVTEPVKTILAGQTGAEVCSGSLNTNRPDTTSLVIAIGPPIMMKFVTLTTKPFNVPTEVSLNPIMVDGTGMCGGCRVRINGENKFACVDGPVFDGHAVDWDELIQRLGAYKDKEKQALDHACKLGLGR